MKTRKGAPAGLFADKCIECGKSPVKRWWIGKVYLDPRTTSFVEIVAADCGGCSETIRRVYLEQHSGAAEVRELPFEELLVMRVMFS